MVNFLIVDIIVNLLNPYYICTSVGYISILALVIIESLFTLVYVVVANISMDSGVL